MARHGHGHLLTPPGVRCHKCMELAVTQAITDLLAKEETDNG